MHSGALHNPDPENEVVQTYVVSDTAWDGQGFITVFFFSSFQQIFTSANYLLSDLYSPDDVHALPAINPTDQQRADDNEELAHEKNSGDFADQNQEDTAMALKVIGDKSSFVLVLRRCLSGASSLGIFVKLVQCKRN